MVPRSARIIPPAPPGWESWEDLMAEALVEAGQAGAAGEVPVGALVVAGVLCLAMPLPVEPLIVHRDLPLLVLAGVLLQMFVTSGARFVRAEALAMIACFVLFLAAQFMGFSLSLP